MNLGNWGLRLIHSLFSLKQKLSTTDVEHYQRVVDNNYPSTRPVTFMFNSNKVHNAKGFRSQITSSPDVNEYIHTFMLIQEARRNN
eukprot:jgi/Botrbrau1/23148/Bobra.0600s0002.1